MLSSGDNFLPGPEFNASLALPDGEPFYDALALDYIGYDALCIGNHDFDFGPDILEEFINSFSMTQPPYLSSNLDFSLEPGLQALADAGRILASTVVNKNGNEFGIIGLTTPNLPFISSPRDVIVDPDIVTIVQDEVDALTGAGINKIILISHLQSITEEIDLAAQLSGVDIFIAGGGDELLTNDPGIALPGMTVYGDYPLIEQDADGNDVYIVTTPGEYKYLGNLIVEFDEMGVVTNIDAASNPFLIDDTTPDPIVFNEVVTPVEDYVADLAANIIGQSEVGLDAIKARIRTRETNEGNLIADALFWQADQLAASFGVNPPDVALQNGGGIRNDNIIPAGDISELTTFDMCPFANFVTMIEDIPPAQFKEILENAVSKVETVSGRFAQISGFSFAYDPTGTAQVIDEQTGVITTPGTRVIEAMLNDGTKIIENGAVAPGAPDLNIATINFLATGGDQYPFNGAPYTSLGVTYQQAVFNYIVGPLSGLIANEDYQINGEGRTKKVPYTEWTGAADDDWFNAGNWTSGIPDATTNAYLEDASKAGALVISGGTANVADFHVLIGSELQIDPSGALTSAGMFTNNGMFSIESDNTGAAGSFIDEGTVEGNGGFAFNRDMKGTGANGDPEGWHYLSTPVAGMNSVDVIEGYFLNTWSETTNLWVHHDDNPVPSNIPFEAMAGWSVKQDLNYTGGTGNVVEFTGNIEDLHTGDFDIDFTGSNLVPGDPSNLNNWNLLGNPYPSPIDAATMVFPAELNASIYYWNDATLSYDEWAGGVGSQYIPATQAFFVKAISDGNLSVDNTMRTHMGAGTFYKSEIDKLLSIEVSGNEFQDVTHIRFENEASAQFDRLFDAYKLLSPAGVPQLYTTLNNVKYAINAMQPLESLPMAFTSETEGLYTIKAIEASDFTSVQLEDLVTGETVNILDEDYTFNYQTGSTVDRFVLHFAPVGIEENSQEDVRIYSFADRVYVHVEDAANTQVNVYNLLGQQVLGEQAENGMNVIRVTENSGYYIVEVVSATSVKTAKVFIQ
jgi:5'-nucleotidase